MNKDKAERAAMQIDNAWKALQQKHNFSLADATFVDKSIATLLEALDEEEEQGFYQ